MIVNDTTWGYVINIKGLNVQGKFINGYYNEMNIFGEVTDAAIFNNEKEMEGVLHYVRNLHNVIAMPEKIKKTLYIVTTEVNEDANVLD